MAISDEIERTVSGYLATITLMNVAVGLLTGIAAYFCGLGAPVLTEYSIRAGVRGKIREADWQCSRF